jgi:hypothetical protein
MHLGVESEWLVLYGNALAPEVKCTELLLGLLRVDPYLRQHRWERRQKTT